MPQSVTAHLSPEQIAGVDGVVLLADGRLGFWPVVDTWPVAAEAIDVVQPVVATSGTASSARDRSGAGGSVDVVTIKATVVPVGAAVDGLLSIEAKQPVSASVAAVSAVARLVVGAVAAGRAAPVLTDERDLAWTVGPWTTHELDQLHHLATTLPPELRAAPIDPAPIDRVDKEPHAADLRPGTPWVRTAGATVSALADAVAESIIAGPASFTTLARRGSAAGLRLDELDHDRLGLLRSELLGEGPILSARLVVDNGARLELDVRSRQDHTVRLPASAIWADPDAAATLGPERPDEWLIAQLSLLARHWPPFQRLLGQLAPSVLHLTDDEFEDLLLHRLDGLRRIGLEVLLPKELVRRLELSARARSSPGESGTSIGAFTLDALVDTRIVASIDGVPLTDEELALLADANRQIVRIRDQFVRVDPRLAGRLQRRLGTGEALAAGLTGTIDFDGEAIPLDLDEAPELTSFIDRLRAVRSTTETDPVEADPADADNRGDRVEIPGLEAELRHYQERGVRWLTQLADLIGGGILADDMGLGKTLQLLALHQIRTARAEHRAESRPGPTLVVGPSSLVANWDREASKFCPKTQVHRYHGPDRTLDGVENDDIVVTSYAILRRDQAILADRHWDLVIADEAQHVKNHRSVTAHALRTVPADVRLAVTGTPVENSLIDLWSLLDWSLPGLLGGITAFKRRFATPIERGDAPATAVALTAITRPFLLRRTKSDPEIVPDLPPRTEIDHLVPLSSEQAALYRAVTQSVMDDVEQSKGIERRGLVLKLLTALKQICNHPDLWHGDQRQAGRPLVGRSGKLDAFDEIVTELDQAGDSVLVFTQYVQMGKILVRRLDQLGLRSRFLHGATPAAAREEMVDEFQDGRFPVFVVSIKAGGTGLNLTKANHVIHYDRWWNPAVENQASDRAWRIGQDRQVFVHRLTSERTLEETIAAELTRKRELAERVVGTGESWIAELDDASLRALVEGVAR